MVLHTCQDLALHYRIHVICPHQNSLHCQLPCTPKAPKQWTPSGFPVWPLSLLITYSPLTAIFQDHRIKVIHVWQPRNFLLVWSFIYSSETIYQTVYLTQMSKIVQTKLSKTEIHPTDAPTLLVLSPQETAPTTHPATPGTPDSSLPEHSHTRSTTKSCWFYRQHSWTSIHCFVLCVTILGYATSTRTTQEPPNESPCFLICTPTTHSHTALLVALLTHCTEVGIKFRLLVWRGSHWPNLGWFGHWNN